ncbi:hypothetical protein Ahu01nite_078460 [Winogradskya humida]|uniref:Uncharacterized protein n=1 Tax=Winogradskya humida TaxID=113566 RepID=A0ABQ4A210_9ACTN|nr:hypothetical protein Ahu01nite_078460 [Actinoplanes humidus]
MQAILVLHHVENPPYAGRKRLIGRPGIEDIREALLCRDPRAKQPHDEASGWRTDMPTRGGDLEHLISAAAPGRY